MIGENIPSEDQQAFNRLLIHLLEELNLPYAIGGSIAAMRYSETRYTRDIDIMFQTDRAGLAQLIESVEALQVYIDPLETVLEYNLPGKLPVSIVDGGTGLKADLYVAQGGGLDLSAMSRRRQLSLYKDPPMDAWFLAPENVILYKLDYFKQSDGASQKHPIDIAKMLAVVGDELDLPYLEHWAAELGVLELWGALWDEFHRPPQIIRAKL